MTGPEFPAWEIWENFSGHWCARIAEAAPPILLRAEDIEGLRHEIRVARQDPEIRAQEERALRIRKEHREYIKTLGNRWGFDKPWIGAPDHEA